MNKENFCQSCGMPLDKPEVMGTNADQSVNEDYCVYCFKDGDFAEDMTMDEMIDVSLTHMKEMFGSDPAFDAAEAEANMRSFFPKLKRWQEQK